MADSISKAGEKHEAKPEAKEVECIIASVKKQLETLGEKIETFADAGIDFKAILTDTAVDKKLTHDITNYPPIKNAIENKITEQAGHLSTNQKEALNELCNEAISETLEGRCSEDELLNKLFQSESLKKLCGINGEKKAILSEDDRAFFLDEVYGPCVAQLFKDLGYIDTKLCNTLSLLAIDDLEQNYTPDEIAKTKVGLLAVGKEKRIATLCKLAKYSNERMLKFKDEELIVLLKKLDDLSLAVSIRVQKHYDDILSCFDVESAPLFESCILNIKMDIQKQLAS